MKIINIQTILQKSCGVCNLPNTFRWPSLGQDNDRLCNNYTLTFDSNTDNPEIDKNNLDEIPPNQSYSNNFFDHVIKTVSYEPYPLTVKDMK